VAAVDEDRGGVRCRRAVADPGPCRGPCVKTDRRDAKKLVSLYRAGLLRFVHPPTPELERAGRTPATIAKRLSALRQLATALDADPAIRTVGSQARSAGRSSHGC
jgi:hypothetical protein